jgi:arsenate reductase-like glutaredoxin family protein
MNRPIYCHKDRETQDFEVKAYFGGRVEARFLGELPESNYVSLDVNSMYSYVMKKYKLPTKLVDIREGISVAELKDWLNEFAVIAEVLIETDEPVYPIRYKGKTVFPVGCFRAYLASGGLDYAIKHNHLVSVQKACFYTKDYLFTDYVNYFIRLKKRYSKQDNKILRTITKDFLNHLYGKFAQRRPIVESKKRTIEHSYSREEVFDCITKQTEVITRLFNTEIIEFGREPAANYFVPIPIHITEYARLYLWKLIKQVGYENLLYCDTDSLKIDEKHLDNLKNKLHPEKLGGLKIEGRFNKFKILGAKYYFTDEKRVIKGVPDKAESLGNYKYAYTQFFKQPTHLRAKVTRFFITEPTIKCNEPFYDKGEVLPNGKIVPFYFQSLY